jgi:hypothetical protein
MKIAQSAVQKVYANVQALDEYLQEYFAMSDSALKSFNGTWDKQLFARLTLELKGQCVCAGVEDMWFQQLRKSIKTFQELPVITPKVQPEQVEPTKP